MHNRRFLGRERPLETLLSAIHDSAKANGSAIIAVDGRAGGGKSSLCAALATLDAGIAIVHTDWFYVPPGLRAAPEDEVGRQIDWRRILEQVVVPLHEGHATHYQRFDWDSQTLAEWHDVAPRGIVLLDGVYSSREEIAPLLRLCIWVDVPRELGLRRAIERDGPKSEDWWMSDWIGDEDRYVLLEDPAERADVVVDGSVTPDLYARGLYRRIR